MSPEKRKKLIEKLVSAIVEDIDCQRELCDLATRAIERDLADLCDDKLAAEYEWVFDENT